MKKTIVCISDTHGFHKKLDLPKGDILIHAGDIAGGRGNGIAYLVEFSNWLLDQDFEHKIVIPGNHDFTFQDTFELARATVARKKNCHVLHESMVELNGLKFYGSAFTPLFHNWAFNLPRGEELKAKWSKIPDDIDVLITHGPPHGVLDLTPGGVLAGCEELLLRVQQIKPKLHVFGHIHENYGLVEDADLGIKYVNCSMFSARHKPENLPIVIELEY